MRGEFALFIVPYAWGPRWVSLGEALIGAAVSSGSIWFAGWLYEKVRHREGLGFGDVKMIFMIGAFLGLPGALLTLIAASLVGAVGGLLFIHFSGKDASTYELPFGSFLGVAGLGIAVYMEVLARLHPR
jgi:leader peptidase (prepilin peptidase)/N-methyltransferase